ncbi:MAG: M23 family metallopeptidase [Candidatus Peribacteraceae bacterium]|nr:M23 family metallopeptidase [Candidatus Peribacteraceae bacterium]
MDEELTILEQRMIPQKKSRKGLIISCIAVCVIVMGGMASMLIKHDTSSLQAAVGGPDEAVENVIDEKDLALEAKKVEERVLRLRTKQSVLTRREEILRYQLKKIDDERKYLKTNSLSDKEYRRSRNTLVLLLKDQENTDKELVDFLRQMWESQGKMRVASFGLDTGKRILLSWPVKPLEGISAFFQDKDYENRFGIEHNAIDIPVEEKTEIKVAATGKVDVIANNGMGYNYLIVRHDGYATLYGHIRKFLVEKGQEVNEGDVIALSGGVPGTPGAGALTTGAHVHFELITAIGHEDPIPYLPYAVGVHDE